MPKLAACFWHLNSFMSFLFGLIYSAEWLLSCLKQSASFQRVLKTIVSLFILFSNIQPWTVTPLTAVFFFVNEGLQKNFVLCESTSEVTFLRVFCYALLVVCPSYCPRRQSLNQTPFFALSGLARSLLCVFLLCAPGSLLFILSSAAVTESNTCFLASGLALDSLFTYVPWGRFL